MHKKQCFSADSENCMTHLSGTNENKPVNAISKREKEKSIQTKKMAKDLVIRKQK